jgi:hypothetical protein
MPLIPFQSERMRHEYMIDQVNLIVEADEWLYRNPRLSSGESLATGSTDMNNLRNRLDWEQVISGTVRHTLDGIGYEFLLRLPRLDTDETVALIFTMDAPHPSSLAFAWYDRNEYSVDRVAERIRLGNLCFGNPFAGTFTERAPINTHSALIVGAGRLLLHSDGKYYFSIPFHPALDPHRQLIYEWLPPASPA